jgi:MinD-like ATPase involved in chromosome partitioning or flagellar assembly
MAVVAIGSVVGAPGASSLTRGLAAVWPGEVDRCVVLEADPDGGRLAAELGVSSESGLLTLASTTRAGSFAALDAVGCATSMGEWSVLCAPPSGEEASSAIGYLAARLSMALRTDLGRLWLIDAGRLTPRSAAAPLVQAADEVVVVSSGLPAALMLLPTRIAALRASGCDVSLVLVGGSVWSPAEIAEFAQCDVLAVLPQVRCQAGDVMMSARVWRPWWSQVAALAGLLAARLSSRVEVV